MDYPIEDLSFIASAYATSVLAAFLPGVEFSFPFLQQNSFTLSFSTSQASLIEKQFPDLEERFRKLWKEYPDYQHHLMTAKNACQLFLSQKQLVWAESTKDYEGGLCSLIRIQDYYIPCFKEALDQIEDLHLRPVLLEKEKEHCLLTCVFACDKQTLKKRYKHWKQAQTAKRFLPKPLLLEGVLLESHTLSLDTLSQQLKTLAVKESFACATVLTSKAPNLEEVTTLLLPHSPSFTIANLYLPRFPGDELSSKNPSLSPCDLWIEALPYEKEEIRLKYCLQFIETHGKITNQKTQLVLALPENKSYARSLRKGTQILREWIAQGEERKIVSHPEKFVRLSWFVQDIFGEYWETAFIDLIDERALSKTAEKEKQRLLTRFSLCNNFLRFLELNSEFNARQL